MTESERKIIIMMPFDEATKVYNNYNSKTIKEAILQDLKIQEKECLLELAKITIIMDAVESGDYRYMSDALIEEMYKIIGRKQEIKLLEQNN